MERIKALTPKRIAKARRAFEMLYDGECTVEIRESVKDEKTKKTGTVVKTLYEQIPCRLSHESKTTGDTRTLPKASQTIMLFLAPEPEITIPPNSKITVEQDGVTETYSHSGVANNFPTHQEIELEKWETWA